MILMKRLQQKWSKVVFMIRFQNNVSALLLLLALFLSHCSQSGRSYAVASNSQRLPYGKKLMSLASSKRRPKPCQQLCECAQQTESSQLSLEMTPVPWLQPCGRPWTRGLNLYVHTHDRCIRNRLHHYRGWEVPGFAVWKLRSKVK